MGAGLSDRDRQRLERARQDAAAKMAAERDRVEHKLAAERDRIQKARRRQAPGGPSGAPLTVSGPDGVAVELSIHRSGVLVLFGGLELGEINLWLLGLPLLLGLVTAVASLFLHRVVFHGGWTVLVQCPDLRRTIKLRTPSEAAATARTQEISAAVRRAGLAALQPPGR